MRITNIKAFKKNTVITKNQVVIHIKLLTYKHNQHINFEKYKRFTKIIKFKKNYARICAFFSQSYGCAYCIVTFEKVNIYGTVT